VRHTVAMLLILSLFWLTLSGHYSALLLAFGALAVILVSWISHRMDVVDHESIPLHLLGRIPRYFAWLAWQVFKSNIEVVRHIWRRDVGIEPTITRVPLPQETDVCRVIYANSINLTPGTLTIDMGGDSLLVHALSQDSRQSLESGDMSRRVSELER